MLFSPSFSHQAHKYPSQSKANRRSPQCSRATLSGCLFPTHTYTLTANIELNRHPYCHHPQSSSMAINGGSSNSISNQQIGTSTSVFISGELCSGAADSTAAAAAARRRMLSGALFPAWLSSSLLFWSFCSFSMSLSAAAAAAVPIDKNGGAKWLECETSAIHTHTQSTTDSGKQASRHSYTTVDHHLLL